MYHSLALDTFTFKHIWNFDALLHEGLTNLKSSLFNIHNQVLSPNFKMRHIFYTPGVNPIKRNVIFKKD